MTSDTLYAQPLEQLVDFNFDEKVANVFPDMIQRSVPGYASIVAMTGILAAEFYQTDSNCYDLGCSLGAASLSMARAIEDETLHIIAVDNSSAMLEKAQHLLLLSKRATKSATKRIPDVPEKEHAHYNESVIELICADINAIKISNASVVVMNFTLQFIAPEQRAKLLQNIYQGMKQDGILILSEKLNYNDKSQQQLLIDMHHFFKNANGYSQLEISQKRQTLENVLIPETLEQHKARLNRAGFKQVEQWFQCFNFSSFIAIK